MTITFPNAVTYVASISSDNLKTDWKTFAVTLLPF